LLVLLFVCQMRIIELLTRASTPTFAELHSHYSRNIVNLPIPTANATAASPYQLLEILGLIIAQTLCLSLIYRTFSDQSPHVSAKISLAISVVVMILVSLQAKFTSADTYAYIGYAKLGLAAYAPPDRPFAGDFAMINAQWGSPIRPSVYGPFWTVMSKLAIMGSATLGQALLALRIFNLAVLGLLILCVASIRKDYAVVVLLAINPAIYYSYIIMGHNDLFAALLVVAAMAVIARRPILGVALAAGSGLVKISFLFISALVFAYDQALKKRLLLFALAVTCCLLLSWLFGGKSYLLDLVQKVNHDNDQEVYPLGKLLLHLMVAVEAVAVIIAVGFGRFFRSAAWNFCAMPVRLSSTYLAWSLPYALKARSYTATFLVMWPLALATIGSTVYGSPWRVRELAMLCILLYVAFDVLSVLRGKYAPDTVTNDLAIAPTPH